MLDNRNSDARKPNARLVQDERRANENNKQWIARHLAADENENRSYVALLGGRDAASIYVRISQAGLRNDHTPSWWSHALLLRNTTRGWKGATWDVPLSLDLLAGYPPATNGIVEGKIDAYASPDSHPNIALLGVPVPEKDLTRTLQRLRQERSTLDTMELLWKWIGFALGIEPRQNPLYEGMAYPSAAVVQAVYAASGLDLTPNVPSAAGCPETLWQAARWWYERLEWDAQTHEVGTDEGVRGVYCVSHALSNEPLGAPASTRTPRRAKKRK